MQRTALEYVHVFQIRRILKFNFNHKTAPRTCISFLTCGAGLQGTFGEDAGPANALAEQHTG